MMGRFGHRREHFLVFLVIRIAEEKLLKAAFKEETKLLKKLFAEEKKLLKQLMSGTKKKRKPRKK